MNHPIYDKNINGIRNRFGRFIAKTNSPIDVLKKLAEESFVRLYDNLAARRFITTFASPKEPKQWVFLVGCYNSGTTLLQNILGSHPDISALPREGVRFTKALSNLELNDHHMVWDAEWTAHAHPNEKESIAAAKKIRKDWAIFWRRGANIYLDKSVSNTARIEWLATHFPNAKFIGLHRNGYCIAEGLHRRSRPPQWLKDKTGDDHYPLEVVGQQWVTANRAMIDGLAKVDDQMMVSFEDFVQNPIAKLEEIFKFVGVSPDKLSFKDSMLQINGTSFPIRNPNADSLERLGNVGKKTLAPIINEMMQELGYET